MGEVGVAVSGFRKYSKNKYNCSFDYEIFAFMSAADESKAQGGEAISIRELIEKARETQ